MNSLALVVCPQQGLLAEGEARGAGGRDFVGLCPFPAPTNIPCTGWDTQLALPLIADPACNLGLQLKQGFRYL